MLVQRRSARMAAADSDLYALLGVPRSADELAIKAAYRKLARLHHPDLNPSTSATSQFQQISYAYEVLSDAEQRQRYDRQFPGPQPPPPDVSGASRTSARRGRASA